MCLVQCLSVETRKTLRQLLEICETREPEKPRTQSMVEVCFISAEYEGVSKSFEPQAFSPFR